MSDKLEISVIQNFEAEGHITGLRYLEHKGDIEIQNIIHLDILHQLGRAILRDGDFITPYINIKLILMSLFWNDKNIYISRYAYDFVSIPYLTILKKRNSLVQNTSWPHWNSNRPPKRIYFHWQKEWWHNHVQSIPMVSVTKYGAQELKQLGADVCYIPHGVNTTKFNPLEQGTDGTLRVLFVGRHQKRKGVDTIMSVIRQVQNENIEFHFVGSGPLTSQVKKSSSKLPIVHHGYVSDKDQLASIYRKSDVLLLPSKRTRPGEPHYPWEELFGIVIIEAYASGLPVISTQNVGPRDIIDQGETGFLVDERDPKAIVNKINRINSDRDMLKDMKFNARNKAVNEYSIQVVSKKWLNVLYRCFS
jgi:glycosyltransferase involved in cell wall biosynthesis